MVRQDPDKSNEDFNCLFAGSIGLQINRTALVRLASFDAVLSKGCEWMRLWLPHWECWLGI